MQNNNSLKMTSPEHFSSSEFGALASDTSQLGLRIFQCTISGRPLAILTFCLSNRNRAKQLKASLGLSLIQSNQVLMPILLKLVFLKSFRRNKILGKNQ